MSRTVINNGDSGLTVRAALNAMLPDPVPLAACLGDSNTAANSNWTDSVEPTNRLMSADGYAEWASVLSHQRVQLPYNYVFGYPGEETSYGLTKLASVLALSPMPSVVLVNFGTNNILHAGSTATFASITADLASIASTLTTAGIRVIFIPIPPNSSFTAAQSDVAVRCNAWMRNAAWNYPKRIAVADTQRIFARNSTAFAPGTNVTYDGTHFATLGAFWVGKAIAEIYETWFPPIDLLPMTDLNFHATNSPYAQKLLTPQFQATGGTATSPATGDVPANFTIDVKNAADVVTTGSLVTGSNGESLSQQVISGGPYTVAEIGEATHGTRLFQSVSNVRVQAGDTLRAACYFEMDAGHSNLSHPTLVFRWGGANAFNASLWPHVKDVPAIAWSGVLLTPPHTFADQPSSGDVVVLMETYFSTVTTGDLSPSGTVRFGRPTLFRCGTENGSLAV